MMSLCKVEYKRELVTTLRSPQSFTNEYPDVRCPSRANIYYNVRKYRGNGTSCNLNKGNSGRPKTARSAENIEAVRNAIEEANGERLNGERPRLSCRRNRLQPDNTFRFEISSLSND